jgi:hypothetical protein
MATTITKLYPTGILQSSVKFDEVTYSSVKVGPAGVYAALFDEVTQSTIKNLATYTEELNNTSQWNGSSGSSQVLVTANAIQSPTNAVTADLLLNTTVSNRHTLIGAFTVSERVATYTWSVHVKSYSASTYLILYFATGYQQADRIGINVNPSNGVINLVGASGLATYITSTSEPKGNGWYRVSVTGNITNTALAGAGTLTGSIGITTSNNDANLVNPAYAGDGATGFYVWGAQFEAGYLTPYQGIGASGVIVTPDFAERKTSTGTYQVSGSFDEVTGMIVTDGLVAYYDAGKEASQPATGATWYDISDIRTNATPSASPPTYNSGGYFTFDRVNAQTYRTSALLLTSWTQPWTIEVWMYVPSSATWSNGTNQSHFVSRGQTTGSWGIIRGSNNNTIHAAIRTDAGVYQTGGSITRDAWYNVLGTWDGVSTVSTYINGVLDSFDTAIILTGVPDTTDLLIGGSTTAWAGSPGLYYEGNIAIVTMYNRALSAAEVNNNFEALRNRFGI